MRKSLLLLLLPLLAVVAGCNNYSTAPDTQAVHEAGGPLSDRELLNCVEPSQKGRDGVFETFYYYPAGSTRSYRALGEGTEADPFRVVSDDNAEMHVPLTISFTLTQNCDKLKEFHTELGNRFSAYMDGDTTDEGWIEMLDYAMGVPADTLLDRVAQQYEWRDLWNDPETKTAVESQLENQLPGMISQQAGGDFFEIQNVLMLKPEPVDRNLTRAINQEQSAVARANAVEQQANAQVKAAKAQTQVAQERAKQKQAEIFGFMLPGMTPEEAVRAYNESQLISKGSNPYQPTYVVPGIPR